MQNSALPAQLRVKDAATFLGVSISTIWRWVREGRLPKGIHLSSRCTVWKRETLEAFVERRAADGTGEAA